MVVSKGFGYRPCKFEDGSIIKGEDRIRIQSIKKLQWHKQRMGLLLFLAVMVLGLILEKAYLAATYGRLSALDILLYVIKIAFALLLLVISIKTIRYEHCYRFNGWKYLLLHKYEGTENQELLDYVKKMKTAG